MTTRFISNEGLVQLLRNSTDDERLALTKTLCPEANRSWNPESLVENVSRAGGHGIANFLRGSGTGYIDIVDDIVDEFKIQGIPSYRSAFKHGITVRELDELVTMTTSPELLKTRTEQGLRTEPYTDADIPSLIQLGHDYCALAEQKILLKILQNAYDELGPAEKGKV